MDRRDFINRASSNIAGLALAMGAPSCFAETSVEAARESEFEALVKSLLTVWCDGMIQHQINEPNSPERHGALACPACNMIHGRCSDAVYPLLHMAHVTGNRKYLDAGIAVFEWSKNVTQEDGSWTNDLDPKSWRGTTIFGAIALAEALHYHGEVLDEQRLSDWKRRLDLAAGGYLYRDFTSLNFTNLNYGLTAVYGFNLFGRVLGKQKYLDRSEELAKGVKNYFTSPNSLIYGEGKPHDNRSGRGLLPVDLGYNVEESLNGLVLYALEKNDAKLLALLVESMNSHLNFMLPDGAWDNSWGTRQAKWSYWGSRTTDGCQPAFSLMAGFNPAFGTAAFKNAELLQRCTADGLLYGGPHYVSHGIKPCIHHTFAHAKVMALLQDKKHMMPKIDQSKPLPRSIAQGVKHYPEIAVWLAAKGPWRGTVSAYDSIYKTKSADHIQQATGGSLSLLYHNKIGTVLAASMARYILVEERNQQPQPGEDFPFTPRIETTVNDKWYTNLYDLEANVEYQLDGDKIAFRVETRLQDEDRNQVPGGDSAHVLQYVFETSKIEITADSLDDGVASNPTALVLPILSPSGEVVRQDSEKRIEIEKPGGTVVMEANVPLSIKKSEKGRVFNMVPGAEAVPILAQLPRQAGMKAVCTIAVL